MKENITLQKPESFIQNIHFFLKQIQETKNWNYNSVKQLPAPFSRDWRSNAVIFTTIIAIIIIPSPWGKILGGGLWWGRIFGCYWWCVWLPNNWNSPCRRTWGWLAGRRLSLDSTLCWRELIKDVSLLLRQAGDLTIHSPDWSSSLSSSSLMKLASSLWRTSFSASVATFILFTKSCKTQSLQKSEQ